MSEPTGEVRVRSVRTRKNENILETAFEFGGGVLRLGLSVVTLPLNLLPAESQQHMRNAAKEMISALVSMPAELADIAGKEVEKWAAEDGVTKAPKDELSAS